MNINTTNYIIITFLIACAGSFLAMQVNFWLGIIIAFGLSFWNSIIFFMKLFGLRK